MRILQLCNKPPVPPNDGGSKAMYNLTRGLLDAGHSVKVLCLSTPKHPLLLDDVPVDFRERTGFEGVYVDTSINVVDAFTDLLTSDNYNVSRFFSPDLDIRLIRLLTKDAFDVVQLESLFMTPYIPNIRRYANAPIVLRSHNLEHLLQERIATGERNMLKRPYRHFLARQLKTYEMAMLDRVDGVAAISDADAAHFREHGTRTPIVTIPFGVDLNDHRSELPQGTPVFFHLGSMDWLPNEEGVRWMLEHVWPLVVRERPDAKLHLAGNRMPKDLLDSEFPGVTVQGRVKRAERYMAGRHVMVVPLLSAGGMRVKIIEGMAMGRAIISTTMGAEGIDHTDGHDLLLGDTPKAFAARVLELLERPERIAELGANARDLVKRKYSNGPIVQDLVAFYTSLLKA